MGMNDISFRRLRQQNLKKEGKDEIILNEKICFTIQVYSTPINGFSQSNYNLGYIL